jgi:hypothetical protein
VALVRQTGKAAQSASHHWLTSGPGVAVVAGPGLGKTRLAAAVCAALDPARFAVIRLVATTASRQVPFGAWGTVLSSTAADPAGTYGAVVSELARRSGRRRPVLVVDDAHVLDGPSAGVLLALVAHRVASVLVTAQAVADSPDAVVKLWKDRLLRRIDLRPLDQDGVRGLAGELLDAPLAESTAVRLAYWSGGNPLHLTELIAHGRRTGELAAADGLWWWREAALPLVPPLPAELLDARLAALDSRGRDALHTVALAEPLGYDVVERIAPGAVDDLEDRGFVRTQDDEYDLRVVLAHPLLAALLDRRLTPARRRRTATTLLAAGAGTDVVTTALWQLAAPDHADVDTLLHAADLTSMSDPRAPGHLRPRQSPLLGGAGSGRRPR